MRGLLLVVVVVVVVVVVLLLLLLPPPVLALLPLLNYQCYQHYHDYGETSAQRRFDRSLGLRQRHVWPIGVGGETAQLTRWQRLTLSVSTRTTWRPRTRVHALHAAPCQLNRSSMFAACARSGQKEQNKRIQLGPKLSFKNSVSKRYWDLNPL